MPKRLFHFILTLLLGVIVTSAHAASFDCKLAHGKIETMICADRAVSALDEQLGAAYARLRKTSGDEKAEKPLQLAWLKLRNNCEDVACLQRAYAARIAELQARSASASPLAGIWKKEYACDRLSGMYAERCKQGERDMFKLAIVVKGDRVCILHVVWANMGNRIDEVEDDQPSMTGKVSGNMATIRFLSTWGGTGTATLRVDGNTLHWKVSAKDDGESWIPDEEVLPRVPADPGERMPKCEG
jgi:uncharacterized protein